MQTYTIAQKMSNSGSIHDIASDTGDREIKFARNAKYAVVLASYYGGKGYSTHSTIARTIEAARKCKGYSYSIIDSAGNHYLDDGNNSLENIEY